ncbi:MAG: transcriptional repressor [Actinomycetota bacterium]|nr:transcriptional repressor [Actinomycetota bacterium]
MDVDTPSRDHERLHATAPADAVRVAVARLRQRGERVTAPRRAVLAALSSRPEHLTADEVSALLDGANVHRATVYRTLDLLAETGVVSHRHTAGGATRYHLAATAAGREHLHGHCRSCGTVAVLPTDALDRVIARLRAVSGFHLEVEQSSLSGLCEKCASGTEGDQSGS